jgi:RNA polymerase sigma-70 factor (ECF subfamily)
MKEEKLEKAVIRLREGDSNALAEIYEITSRGVFTFVLPILHDYQLAEDVMQQTFVTAYENIQSYQPGTNARNWLLTIAKNMALTEIKKRKREVSYDFDQDNHPDGVYFLGNIDSPTIALANKVLAEDEFNIVIMYAVGEYKHREIAEFLHMPLRHGDVEIQQRPQENAEGARRKSNAV